ncbi:MAG: HEAT repeat domain-containing protein [Dehalococcoidia bacterium]|nr:HEAT repeat domain-containing protein [Dehalococcoidia bacterium]
MPARSRDLEEILETVGAGAEPAEADIRVLSDLDRAGADALRQAWPGLPLASRVALLGRLQRLAQDHVELDFTQVARIGLDDPSPEARRLAIAALWEDTGRPTAERLADLLVHDPDEAVRAASAAALRPFVLLREFEEFDAAQGDAVVEALRLAARNEREAIDVRANAVESLGARTLPWIGTVIADAYYDDDRRLRLAALHAMGESAQERWIEYLEDQLVSDDPQFRFEAVTACGIIGSEEAVEALAPLLDDEDAEVARAAVQALGEIGGEVSIRYLQAFARHAPAPFDGLVASALENARFVTSEEL